MIASESPPQPHQPGRTEGVGQARTRWIRGHRTALLWRALAASSAGAQTLREAVERAWERQPAAQAQRYRLLELAARAQAANACWPSPPAVGLSE